MALDRDESWRGGVWTLCGACLKGPFRSCIGFAKRKRWSGSTRRRPRLLGPKGWRDSDGDGVLDQSGRALTVQLNFPGPSASRSMHRPHVQEQWRGIGVKVDLLRWMDRYGASVATREIRRRLRFRGHGSEPCGMVQSWSCAGRNGSNVGSTVIRRSTR
jgi:hypothetical protein